MRKTADKKAKKRAYQREYMRKYRREHVFIAEKRRRVELLRT